MSEIVLNQHYSSNPKAERQVRSVAYAPDNLPSYSLCRDEDMNKKIGKMNKDIYESSKHQKNKKFKSFIKWFGAAVVLIFGIRFIRRKL